MVVVPSVVIFRNVTCSEKVPVLVPRRATLPLLEKVIAPVRGLASDTVGVAAEPVTVILVPGVMDETGVAPLAAAVIIPSALTVTVALVYVLGVTPEFANGS